MKNLTKELNMHLRESAMSAYQYGLTDCAMFVAKWADTVSGSRVREGLEGAYDSVESGLELIGDQLGRYAAKALLRSGWARADGLPFGAIAICEDKLGVVVYVLDVPLIASPIDGGGIAFTTTEKVKGVYQWAK